MKIQMTWQKLWDVCVIVVSIILLIAFGFFIARGEDAPPRGVPPVVEQPASEPANAPSQNAINPERRKQAADFLQQLGGYRHELERVCAEEIEIADAFLSDDARRMDRVWEKIDALQHLNELNGLADALMIKRAQHEARRTFFLACLEHEQLSAVNIGVDSFGMKLTSASESLEVGVRKQYDALKRAIWLTNNAPAIDEWEPIRYPTTDIDFLRIRVPVHYWVALQVFSVFADDLQETEQFACAKIVSIRAYLAKEAAAQAEEKKRKSQESVEPSKEEK